MTMTNSTIAAIATPTGSGGIGIIKISGQDAASVAASVFRPSDRNAVFSKDGIPVQSHHLYHGYIADPQNGRILDEVLLAVMLAPHSYTREDVVEIQAHGGFAVLNAILNLVLERGARLADPGEFTKRAYINGRIDLTQAEAVIDIINAKTESSLEIAAAQIRGSIKERIESVRDTLLFMLIETEAAIDFPDDVEESIDTDTMTQVLEKEVVNQLNGLIDQYENAHFLRDGLKVLIAGRPNVGKSSLMNSLLRKDRAIVTPVPGTTRDVIEETLNIRGIPVIISDTAGLHKTDDPIEILGIKKTYRHIRDADLILFMTDLSCPLTNDDHKIYEDICHKAFMIVTNKSDLADDEFCPELPDLWKKTYVIKTSAIYDRGLDTLRDMIAEFSTGGYDERNTVIPNLRHKIALEGSLRAVSAAADGIRTGMPFELINIDIREAADLLGEIMGITIREDVLDQIFSRFCIGK